MQKLTLKTMSACLGAVLMALSLSVSAAEKPQFGADRHVARGIPCTMCHGPDMKNPEYPEEGTCLKCHNKESLAAKTAKIEPNPHKAPHNGDCTLCHLQHEAPVNYYNQCHQFNYKVR